MKLEEVLSEYQYRNVGQFRAIAESLGYKEEYNKGSLCFTNGDEVYRTSIDKIRAFTKDEPDLSITDASMGRICQFFDREQALSPDYEATLSKEGINIVNWGDLKGDAKDRFTVIDHKNKVCYTGKELYEYALQNNYILDGKGTQLEKGVYSDLTNIYGKQAKVRLTENGLSVVYRKEALVIPDKIQGQKLSQKQKQDLIDGNVIVLSTKKGDILLQVDRDLNAVVVRSEKELSIPAQIGGYELTPADKYLLANSHSLDNKLLKTPEGKYIIADVSMTSDKKGYIFSNVQSISETKAKEILQAKEASKDVEQLREQSPERTPGKDPVSDRDLDKELKEAVAKNDYEKIASLKEEGYKPSEEVIRGLGQDTKIDQTQAIVIEKLFGTKPDVQKAEEVTQAKEETKDAKVELNADLANAKVVSPELDKEFKEAVEKEDFIKISQLKEQGYQPSKELIQSLGETASSNTMIAVQKIFNLKGTANTLGDVKLAHNQQSADKDLKRPLVNTLNKMFADL